MSSEGVQKIIAEIQKSAERQIADIRAQAEEKTGAIMEEARAQAAGQEQSILARGEQEARRESQRILAEARIQARRETVRAQESVVQESFAQARERLARIATGGADGDISYAAVLERLIAESIISAGTAELEVLVNPRDRSVVTPALLEKIAGQTGSELGCTVTLRVADEPLQCSGGVVVRSVDGNLRVENTFESRLARFREDIRTRVAGELFPQES